MNARALIKNQKYEILKFKPSNRITFYNPPLFYIISVDGMHYPGYQFYTEDEAVKFAEKYNFLLKNPSK